MGCGREYGGVLSIGELLEACTRERLKDPDPSFAGTGERFAVAS